MFCSGLGETESALALSQQLVGVAPTQHEFWGLKKCRIVEWEGATHKLPIRAPSTRVATRDHHGECRNGGAAQRSNHLAVENRVRPFLCFERYYACFVPLGPQKKNDDFGSGHTKKPRMLGAHVCLKYSAGRCTKYAQHGDSCNAPCSFLGG